MSGGKKRSGFQITSVTSDYGPSPLGTSPPHGASVSADPDAGKEVLNGTPSGAGTGESGDHRPAFRSGSLTGDDGGRFEASVPNGPVLLDVVRNVQRHASTSQPGTPRALRRHAAASQELTAGAQSPQSSRFRVVRLGQGLGEPYRRGRWTCVDFLEREGGEERGLRRVMDSMRHAHSLESLETVGLGGVEGGFKPLGQVRALKAGHMVHSQGTTHLRAHLGGEGGVLGRPSCREQGDTKLWTFSSGPPSPSHRERFNVRLVEAASPPPGQQQQDARVRSPPHYLSASGRPRHIPPPLRLDVDPVGKPLLRETLSQPSSPGRALSRDGLFQHAVQPSPHPSALSLAQSMFGAEGSFDLDDDSASGGSMIAIDNKIEQAMDLVKTHLMMAVREEVEVLREQIKELSERNAQLERENHILRALRERE
ncbi:TSC22 domain family protein 4 isoform X5 [Scleropages formosus]|uniref:TSC22 domain family protein 4-like n=1 Tax=Scleropages formosus TaxID=113540 RepID=A0A8C9SDT3_SCLFO|nr:TSC22 domain family protein 4 isoform X5 [Scleropages formosus]